MTRNKKAVGFLLVCLIAGALLLFPGVMLATEPEAAGGAAGGDGWVWRTYPPHWPWG